MHLFGGQVLDGEQVLHRMVTPAAVAETCLVAAGRQVLADEVRPDGQLAVPAIDHHRQLHRLWPP